MMNHPTRSRRVTDNLEPRTWPGKLRAASHTHAPWLHHHDPRVTRGLLTATLLTWLFFWGPGTAHAILILTGTWGAQDLSGYNAAQSWFGQPTHNLWAVGLVGVAGYAILHSLNLGHLLALPRTRDAWRNESRAGVVWLAGALFADVAASLTPGTRTYGYALHPSAMQHAATITNNMLVGAMEEFFWGPVLLTVLRRRGWSWPAVLATAAILRGVFHLYYGLPAWPLFLWPLAVAIGYATTGKWWIPFAAHALNNLTAYTSAYHWPLATTLAASAETLLTLGLWVFLLLVDHRRRTTTTPS